MPIEGFQKDEGEIKFHVYVVYSGSKKSGGISALAQRVDILYVIGVSDTGNP